MVDKFMGDAILIFWRSEFTKVEQDAKSCEMAIAMRQQTNCYSERWKKMGYSALHIRMGIKKRLLPRKGNYGATHRIV